jgi:uncharacterized protein YpmB
MSDKRNFSVVGNKKFCNKSVFHSKTPASAAAKVFNVICTTHKECHRIIKVVDKDRNKVYRYKVSRVISDKDVKLKGVKKPVHFRFSTKVESMNK